MRRRGSRWRGGGRRTPPQVDSPHSSLLTLQLVGRALQPQGSARSPAPPLRSQSPVPAYRREPRSLWGSLDTPTQSSKALPTPSALPLPLEFKPGGTAEGAPSRPELAYADGVPSAPNHLPAVRGGTQSPRPLQRAPYLPAGARPAGSAGSRFRPAVLEVMSPSHEAAARTCHSLNPSRGKPGTKGGVCSGFGSQVCLLPPRTNQCPPYCAPGSLSVKWVAGEALESSL